MGLGRVQTRILLCPLKHDATKRGKVNTDVKHAGRPVEDAAGRRSPLTGSFLSHAERDGSTRMKLMNDSTVVLGPMWHYLRMRTSPMGLLIR